MPIGSNGVVEVFPPPGGTAGQALVKVDSANYNWTWGAGGGGGAGVASISAGTTQATGLQVVFADSNGVSFGVNGNTVTATVVGGGGGGPGLSAGTQSVNTGTVVFSNSNGISFGMSGSSRITASYTVPGATVFSNSNNVSFGLNGSTVTATATVAATVFSNSNNVSFGLNGSTITATATLPAQTNQSIGFYASSQTYGQSSSSTVDARSISVVAQGAISAGLSGGSLVLSVAAGAQSNQTLGIYGSSQTTAQSSSSTVDARSISYVGMGAISVGLSGGSVIISAPDTVSLPPQTNQSIGIYGSSQTTGQSSFSTVDARSLTIVGGGAVSVGMSAGSLLISGAAGAQTNQTMGIYGSSQTYGQSSSSTVDARSLSVVGSGGISVGMSAGSLLISGQTTAAQTNQSIGIYGSSQTTGASSSSTVDARSISVVGAGVVSVGMTGGSVVISATQSNQGFSAAGGSSAFQTLGFSDNSNASWTNTNGSVAIRSVRASMYATSNTTQSSTGTANLNSVIYNGAGGVSVGISGDSVVVSAPVTSSLSATGIVSIAVNASTISIGAALTSMSRMIVPEGMQLTAVTAPTLASASFRYVDMKGYLTATRIDIPVGMSFSTTAGAGTQTLQMSVYAVVYTKNAASLSSVSSGSTQSTWTMASNTAGQTQLSQAAIRMVSVPVNINMVPGEYYVGINLVTAQTAVSATFSMYGGNDLQTVSNFADMGSTTNNTTGQLWGAMGVYNAASTGLPASVSISSINQTGSALSAANIALVFRNV